MTIFKVQKGYLGGKTPFYSIPTEISTNAFTDKLTIN